jgi:hypothetical protein
MDAHPALPGAHFLAARLQRITIARIAGRSMQPAPATSHCSERHMTHNNPR